MTQTAGRKTKLALVVIALATLVGVYLGWRLFWFLTDDAFIAFRYISNGHLGYGYVWNAPPFRPVEGYTSFLWVVLLDVVWRVSGVEPPAAANNVSLLFTYLTLLVGGSMVLQLKLTERLAKYRLLWLSLVLVGVGTNRTFLAWSSSGLETAMFNFFLTLWLYCSLYVQSRGRWWLCGLTVTTALLCLTRPDGLMFAGVTVGVIGWELWRQSGRQEADGRRQTAGVGVLKLLPWATPLLIIPVHVLWRRWVYGAWLPNTYYAKTIAGRIWPESGLRYLGSFVLEYALWVWLLLLLVVLVSSWRRVGALRDLAAVSLPKVVVCGAVVAHLLYYTIVIGGDHFEYRVYSQLVLLIFITFVWLLNALRLPAKSAALLLGLFIVLSWPTPWLHWFATHNLTTVEQTMNLKVPVAKVVERKFPATPGFVLGYFRVFDTLQAWLISHFVCMRHQQHKVFTTHQLDNLPTRAEGLLMSASGFPVLKANAAGVVSWVLPRVNIIDDFGLNDWVIARNPDVLDLRLIAHERQPPIGYVECFAPNVLLSNRNVAVPERAEPLTAQKIVECEQHYAALVASGVKPTPIPVQNVIDDPRFFAGQQYRDVLNREPDPDGWDNWTGILRRCPTDSSCFNRERAKATLVFSEVPETQLSAFFIFRLYRATYARAPRFAEYQNDRNLLATDCHNDLALFLADWMRQESFLAAYPETATAAQFVNRLFDNAGLQSFSAELNRQLEALKAGKSRSDVLKDVVDLEEFKRREHDRDLVLLQFFFQLRRDVDYQDSRYQPWLEKLERKEPIDPQHVICLFLTSDEYQRRFGSVITHNNVECQ